LWGRCGLEAGKEDVMLGKKPFGHKKTTTGACGTFGADEWAHFGSDEWAHFGVDNYLYDSFGEKVPNYGFGAEPAAPVPPPHETLADFFDRIKVGLAKLVGKKVTPAPLGSTTPVTAAPPPAPAPPPPPAPPPATVSGFGWL
jgi:hypothetical protein